jgi:hypothetical protein
MESGITQYVLGWGAHRVVNKDTHPALASYAFAPLRFPGCAKITPALLLDPAIGAFFFLLY